MSDTCFYCDRPAVYLCDFVLQWGAYSQAVVDAAKDKNMGADEFAKVMIDGMAKPDAIIHETCDRPLCEAHRKQIGQRFVCGTIEGAGADTVDLCPGHAMFPDGFKPDFEPVKTGGTGRAA